MGRRPYRGMQRDTIEYIQAMLAQLRELAKGEDCTMLAYLIEMACIEASDVIYGRQADYDVDVKSGNLQQKGNGTA